MPGFSELSKKFILFYLYSIIQGSSTCLHTTVTSPPSLEQSRVKDHEVCSFGFLPTTEQYKIVHVPCYLDYQTGLFNNHMLVPQAGGGIDHRGVTSRPRGDLAAAATTASLSSTTRCSGSSWTTLGGSRRSTSRMSASRPPCGSRCKPRATSSPVWRRCTGSLVSLPPPTMENGHRPRFCVHRRLS